MAAVYVATSLLNRERAQQLQKRFLSYGVRTTYDWTIHGKIDDLEELGRIGLAEATGVREADVVFMIQPGRLGTHFEAGMGWALGKPVVILEEVPVERCSFYYLPNVHRFPTEEAAVTFTLNLLGLL